ncbi:fungal-specific transcription factor domain-containing protein [Thamnidium elegans]|nr:fungal-specific transcription factor domain-containing protein [Thamnidium elegans]
MEKKIQQTYSTKRQKTGTTSQPSSLLSNLFEESGMMGPRQWPSGVSYDSIHYLGDLSTVQFFYNKLRIQDHSKLQGHTIKKFGDSVVLIADPGVPSQQSSKIPEFEWPQNIHPVGEDIHKYIYTVTGLDKYTAVRLLKIYFSHIHPILPVIDKTEFLKQYRDRVETYPSGELLNAMFGAAARFVECESLEPERKRCLPSDAVWDIPVGWSNHFFDQAEYIITTWSSSQTVSNVQAIILILNHRGDRESKSSACWQLGGYAIRLAHLLGLHRSCEDWDIPRNEKETRKRVWWALYITDRFQTAILGRPINLRDEDISVPYPDSGADIEEVLDAYKADKSKIQSNQAFPRFPCLTAPYNYETISEPDRPQIYELFIQFIKLSEILGRILQGLHTPMAKKFSSQHGSDDLVSRLDYELTEWRHNFPHALKKIQLPDFNETVGHFAPVIASMLMFYCGCLIFLHQPFIKRTHSKSSSTSQQICSSAAARGMKIACRLTARDYLMCPYSFTLYPIRQFGVIHMFNSKNPDRHISSSADFYLKRAKQLLERIQHISSTATSLYNLFNDVASNQLPLLAVDQHMPHHSASQEVSYAKQPNNQTMTSIMDDIMLQPNQQKSAAVPQQLVEHNTVPIEEAFSLTQFGYNTPHDESSLDYILKNLNWMPGLSTEINPYNPIDDQDTHLFRSEPNNVFWELPPTMEGLNEWIDAMNENGWKVFDQ